MPVYGEALHNYLEFTCEDYKRPEGSTIHVYPALKEPEDRDALIRGLLDGQLSTTATDEFTTPKEVRLWGKTIETLCGGQNGIETRLPVVYSKFVVQQNASLRRFVDITSTNAAKIFGLYPRKGVIAVGSDADFALIDPNIHKRLTLADLHSDCDHSIWEHFECRGYPIMTMVRGQIVVESPNLVGNTSRGIYLKRKIANEILAGSAL
jgi:dihydropyrimidinase